MIPLSATASCTIIYYFVSRPEKSGMKVSACRFFLLSAGEGRVELSQEAEEGLRVTVTLALMAVSALLAHRQAGRAGPWVEKLPPADLLNN